MDTGRKIMNLRKDRGVAQHSLAAMTSVTPSALSRIEAGIHQPRGPVALRIARELGVTSDYILDDEAPYPPPSSALLKNLKKNSISESRGQTIKVSAREKRIVDSLRSLDSDRHNLIEAVLDADLDTVRTAILALERSDLLESLDPDDRTRMLKDLNKS